MGELKAYTILYRYKNSQAQEQCDPYGFKVMAENLEHAEEQFENAEPDCDILWVLDTDDYSVALKNYYESY